MNRRRARLIAGCLPLTAPEMSARDEFPLGPSLLGPQGENLNDSSANGAWLDDAPPLALPSDG